MLQESAADPKKAFRRRKFLILATIRVQEAGNTKVPPRGKSLDGQDLDEMARRNSSDLPVRFGHLLQRKCRGLSALLLWTAGSVSFSRRGDNLTLALCAGADPGSLVYGAGIIMWSDFTGPVSEFPRAHHAAPPHTTAAGSPSVAYYQLIHSRYWPYCVVFAGQNRCIISVIGLDLSLRVNQVCVYVCRRV